MQSQLPESRNTDCMIAVITPELILVEGGSFEMGSNRNDDEMPIHNVTLSDYYIAKYPITQAQWVTLMGYNPSDMGEDGNEVLFVSGDTWKAINEQIPIKLSEEKDGLIPIGYVQKDIDDNCPVVNVSWCECIEFCNVLNKQHGYEPMYIKCGRGMKWMRGRKGFRLPTEAEWEFAARGGNNSNGFTYSGSNDIDTVGWTGDNSGEDYHPVGELQPNELGVYDMSGNTYEWCWDRYGSYQNQNELNPIGSAKGNYRVLRGGSIFFHEDCCSVSCRNQDRANLINPDYGFRVVLEL